MWYVKRNHSIKSMFKIKRAKVWALAVGVLASSVSTVVMSDDYVGREDVDTFIDEMVTEHQFSREDLQSWFAVAKKKQSILDAISRPAEKRLTWAEYRNIFIKPSRINKGVEFWEQNSDVLAKAEKEFGVPASVIVAIIGVETLYGGNKGSFRVVDALSTLGFDYPPRSKFFRSELKHFFLLAKEQGQDPLRLTGSYAGAMGYGQFIPSSYRAYAVDYDNDQFADIWNNTTDAIGSVANYFHEHGWKPGQPVVVRTRIADGYDKEILNDSLKPKHTVESLQQQGYMPLDNLEPSQTANAIRLEGKQGAEFWVGLHNFYVITRYNHSRLYAMAVWQLSQAILEAKQSS